MHTGIQLSCDLEALMLGRLDFLTLSERIRAFQFRHNPVMTHFAAALGFIPPYIPIRFFKEHRMVCMDVKTPLVFHSSGTTGQIPSRHEVHDPELYARVSRHAYECMFGSEPRVILALLPNYLERGYSSLVYMVQELITSYGLPGSGFYLNDFEALHQGIIEHGDAGEPIMMIGVSYALLDFAEKYPVPLPLGTIVMETGGMKGRKKEITRKELHETLKKAWSLDTIHSEYGMTELLSQAYACSDGIFNPAVTMRVETMDPYLPGKMLPRGTRGRLCITDLANLWSCSFIMTDDLGVVYPDGTFEVFGRIDTAEIRGCSLMYTS